VSNKIEVSTFYAIPILSKS